MLDQIIHLDQELFVWLNQLGSSTFDGFWLFVTTKWNWIPLYIILLIVFYRKLGWKQTLVILVFTVVLITATDQLCNLFKKVIFLRPRPCHEPDVFGKYRLVKDTCGGAYGFVSAHAANHLAVAIFLGSILKKYWKYSLILLIFWALMIGYSRIYVGVHYPLDVLGGFLIGIILGTICYQLYLKFKPRFED